MKAIKNYYLYYLSLFLLANIAHALNGNMGLHEGYTPDGSSANPWLIEDLEDFESFADPANAELYWSVNIHTHLKCSLDLSDRTYNKAVIANDITKVNNFSTYGTVAIYKYETEGVMYNGTFNGNSFSINSLNIYCESDSSSYLGLFGALGPSANIQNLMLNNVLIDKDQSVKSYAVGSIAGINYGNIQNCMAVGRVSGYEDTGGICGLNFGSISNSKSNVTIGDSNTNDIFTTGGFCGYSNGNISNSYAICSFPCDGVYCGSFIGLADQDSVIKHCYCIGGNYECGFCGFNYGTTIGCYWMQEEGCTSSGGYALSFSQMISPDSFIGWNDGSWQINYYYSQYPYPTLSWENYQIDLGYIIEDFPFPGEIISTDYPQRTYSGNGTEQEPFIITGIEDLNNLSQRENDWGSCFILQNDIDACELDNYLPIADFSGTFDGQGHSIYNLSFTRQRQSYSNYGIFSRVTGTVKKLNLRNMAAKNILLSGGICSLLYGGNILNCSIYQNEYATDQITDVSYFGGICGLVINGSIDNCSFDGYISGKNIIAGICYAAYFTDIAHSYTNIKFNGYSSISGICNLLASSNINQCYSNSIITIEESTLNDTWFPESCFISSISSSSASNCFSEGTITFILDTGSQFNTGYGFAGNIYNSTLLNCYTNCSTEKPGFGNSYYNNNNTITNCFWNTDKVSLLEDLEYYYGTPVTNEQMHNKTTYTNANWDFNYNKDDGSDDIWYFAETPRLQFFKNGEFIDMEEFAMLTAQWLNSNCTTNDNCSYFDYAPDGMINIDDLYILCQHWLTQHQFSDISNLVN